MRKKWFCWIFVLVGSVVLATIVQNEGRDKNASEMSPSTSQKEELAALEKEAPAINKRLEQIDASLRACFEQKAKPRPNQFKPDVLEYYSYNDWGYSAKILMKECVADIIAWCHAQNTFGGCDEHKEACTLFCKFDADGSLSKIDIFSEAHITELANNVIKQSIPKTKHNVTNNAFRDCVVNVIIKGQTLGAFSSSISPYLNDPNYFSALNDGCGQEIQALNHECIIKNPRMDENQCAQQTGMEATTMLRFYNLNQMQKRVIKN
jgi:hypothetical protein